MKQLNVFYKNSLWFLYIINALLFVYLLPVLGRLIFSCHWNTVWKSVRLFAKNGLGIFGVKVEIVNPHGIDLEQHYILFANHRSWFDQIALIHAVKRPFHILSKKGYFDIPLFGRGMKAVECVPVTDKTISFEEFDNIIGFLGRQESLLVFVEGTRGEGREMLPFMPGAFKFSSFSQTPLLPIHIIGSEEILSKKYPLHSITSGKIMLFIEPPVVVPRKGYKEFVKKFEEQYRQRNRELYDQYLGMNRAQL